MKKQDLEKQKALDAVSGKAVVTVGVPYSVIEGMKRSLYLDKNVNLPVGTFSLLVGKRFKSGANDASCVLRHTSADGSTFEFRVNASELKALNVLKADANDNAYCDDFKGTIKEGVIELV
jgi:hypothetical protein